VNYLALIAGVFVAVTSSLPAQAQPSGRDHPRRFERQQQDSDIQRHRDMRRDQEFRHRREDDEGRRGRLTPEERQQLRRDIREHGRDVYRDRLHRF